MWSRPEEESGMLRAVLPMVAVLGLVLLPHPGEATTIAALNSLKLDVPTSDTMFPAGPGSDAINNNCLACHSADHVLNQPTLSKEAWQEVVNKMITAYKAPVSPDDAKAIVDYLVHTKGKGAS
jgi:cytochrome c5